MKMTFTSNYLRIPLKGGAHLEPASETTDLKAISGDQDTESGMNAPSCLMDIFFHCSTVDTGKYC